MLELYLGLEVIIHQLSGMLAWANTQKRVLLSFKSGG
jgi:hypothetical protein